LALGNAATREGNDEQGFPAGLALANASESVIRMFSPLSSGQDNGSGQAEVYFVY
jgi:hypothetical protein